MSSKENLTKVLRTFFDTPFFLIAIIMIFSLIIYDVGKNVTIGKYFVSKEYEIKGENIQIVISDTGFVSDINSDTILWCVSGTYDYRDAQLISYRMKESGVSVYAEFVNNFDRLNEGDSIIIKYANKSFFDLFYNKIFGPL